jgi:hypothetical protein
MVVLKFQQASINWKLALSQLQIITIVMTWESHLGNHWDLFFFFELGLSMLPKLVLNPWAQASNPPTLAFHVVGTLGTCYMPVLHITLTTLWKTGGGEG